MEKNVFHSILMALLFALAAGPVGGQTVGLNLVGTKNCSTNTYCVALRAYHAGGSGAFQIGTSSALLTYDPATLAFLSYASTHFDASETCSGNSGIWAAHKYDAASRPGEFLLTLDLLDAANSCPSLAAGDTLEIGSICFEILQQGASPNITFDPDFTGFNLAQPSNNGLAFAQIGALDSLFEVNSLACDCPGAGEPCDDNNVYTVEDQYDTYCACRGEYLDSDEDGTLDGIDACLDEVYEAENAQYVGPVLGSSYPQFTWLRYLDYINSSNDYIQFTVAAADSGLHTLKFRYALSTGNRPLRLDIDGVTAVPSLNFPATGSYSTWGIVSHAQVLTAGTHTVRITAIGSSGPNVDHLMLSFCTSCTQSGQPCSDGDTCTLNDVYDADCACHGEYRDSDADGVCDTEDLCEGGDDLADADADGTPDFCDACDNALVGTPCDDGNPCTINDAYDADCACAGTFSGNDADADGVCDAYDICPGSNDLTDVDGDGTPDGCDACNNLLIGTPCNDGDTCTILDRTTAACGCAGIYIDSDADGVCNILDICEGHDDTQDEDSDGIPDGCDPCNNNLNGTPCNDNDLCTINDLYDNDCGCAGTFDDDDDDTVCNAEDLCSGFNDLDDADSDGTPDGCDNCPDAVYQAENAYYTGNLFSTYYSGYTGTGYLRTSTPGDTVRFTVNIAEGGAYLATMRYAQSWGSNRRLQRWLDGAVLDTLRFNSTGAGNIWLRKEFWFDLAPGTHTIAFVYLLESNYPSLDYFSLCHQTLDPVSVAASSTMPACPGGANGTATASATGGTGQYVFHWSTGAWGTTATNLAAGTYTVTATDALGNTGTASIVVAQPAPIALAFANTPSSGSNGAVDLTVTGGTAGYTYTWHTGATSQDLAGLAVGYYKVTVKDANNCTQTGLTNVYPADFCIDAVFEAENAYRVGATFGNYNGGFTNTGYVDYTNNTGDTVIFTVAPQTPGSQLISLRYANSYNLRSLQVRVDGAVVVPALAFPVTGSWTTWGKVSFYVNLSAGAHSIALTTTGTNGPNLDFLTVCQQTPPALTIALSKINISCPGGSNGTATAAPAGGTGQYTLAWSTGATSTSITNLLPGTYTCTVTDSYGTTATASTVISQPAPIALSFVATPSSGSNGAVDLTVAGGTAGYTYTWHTGATSQDLAGLAVGYYKVTVKDANNCTQTGLTNVYPADFCMNAAFEAENAYRSGAILGTWVAGYTGTGFVDYVNTTGDTVIFTVAPQTPGSQLISLRYANPPSTRLLEVRVDGAVVVPALAFPSTGAWENWGKVSFYANLTAGNHAVQFTTIGTYGPNLDFLTVCQQTPPALTIALSKTNVSCPSGSNGTATAAPTGGTGQYALAWSNGSTATTISNLPAGTYTCTVTDSYGATATASVAVTQPAPIETAFVATPSSGSNGAVDMTVTGGTAGYTYTWHTGATSQDLAGLAVGYYKVTVKDTNNCTKTALTNVYPADFCMDLVSEAENAYRAGATFGSYYGGFTGTGYADYTNNTGDTVIFSLAPQTPGAQLVSVRYANAYSTRYLQVRVDGALVVPALAFPTTGSSTTWGKATFYANLSAGTHSMEFTTTGTNGPNVDFLSICRQDPPPVAVSATQVNVSCPGGANGSATATATGGTGLFTYTWSTGAATATATGLAAGTYTVTATDSFGATATKSVTITQPANIAIAISKTNVSCYGTATGSATATASGGTPPFAYKWSNNKTTAAITNLIAGTYTVTATDSRGCSAANSVTITQPNVLSVSYTSTPSYNGNGAIDLSVSGGTGTKTYLWNTGATTQDLTSIGAGTYKVTVTDAKACTATKSIVIYDVPQMEAGTLDAVSSTWQTVYLDSLYSSMVVIASVELPSGSVGPVVARIKNAVADTFQIRVQTPGGGTLGSYKVHYLVVQEGTYTQANHGITMEAKKFTSTITARDDNWAMEPRTYANTYSGSPVVVGQVMTYWDSRWSSFWSSKSDSRTTPPSSSSFACGKHIGEDTAIVRNAEKIGYMVLKNGLYTVGNLQFAAGVGSDIVMGVDNSATGYTYATSLPGATGAVLSSAAMDDANGGWPVLFGTNPIQNGTLTLAIDEDKISDTERAHSTEQVAYVAFAHIVPPLRPSAGRTPTSAPDASASLWLAPNPTAQWLTVQARLAAPGEAFDLQIVDMNGRTIATKTGLRASEHAAQHIFDVRALADGVYIVQMKTATGIATAKFVKAGN